MVVERDHGAPTQAPTVTKTEGFISLSYTAKKKKEVVHHCVTCGEETEGAVGCRYVCEDCFEYGEY